jgi:hypothetical protein
MALASMTTFRSEAVMTSLFHLVDQYRSLQSLDIEEVPEDVLRDTLEGLGGELQLKATNVAMYQQNLQSMADAVKEASAKMAARAKRLQSKADSLKHYLQSCMEAAQITKIESPELSLVIKNNPPALFIAEGAAIPSEFMIVPPPPVAYPDKAAIKRALNEGRAIDGCRLEQGRRLDIR